MRAAIVAVLALLVVALTTGASGEKAGTTVRSTLAGESVRVTLPTGEADPKGLVIWFHGQGGNVNDRVDGPFLTALSRDGWAVASSNFHRESWGNEASTDDAANLIEWAERESGAQTRLWVSGSMGASISLNAMVHGVTPPDCWYGVKPAIALNRMQTVPGATTFIRAAFRGTVPADRNTVANLDRLPLSTRYRVVASMGDELVPYELNSAPLISQLQARDAELSVLEASGFHDDPSHFDSDDLVSYANSCLEPGSGVDTAAE